MVLSHITGAAKIDSLPPFKLLIKGKDKELIWCLHGNCFYTVSKHFTAARLKWRLGYIADAQLPRRQLSSYRRCSLTSLKRIRLLFYLFSLIPHFNISQVLFRTSGEIQFKWKSKDIIHSTQEFQTAFYLLFNLDDNRNHVTNKEISVNLILLPGLI